MPRWLIGSAGIVALAATRGAAATPDGDPVRLVYEAPAECPSANEFTEQVRSRTPRAREPRPGEAPRTFRVLIEKRGRIVVGTLAIDEPSGVEASRQLSAKSCPDVVEALALIVALAIDPRASTGPALANTAGELEAPAVPPPVPGPTAQPSSRASPVRRTRRRLTVDAGVHAGAAHGLSPQPQLDVGIAAGVVLQARGLLAPAAWLEWSHVPRRVFARAEGDAAFNAELAAADLCPIDVVASERAELRACARLEAGQLAATGEQTLNARGSRSTWLAPGVGIRSSLSPLHPLWLGVTGNLVAPATRDRFLLGTSVVHEVPPLAFRVSFTLSVRPR